MSDNGMLRLAHLSYVVLSYDPRAFLWMSSMPARDKGNCHRIIRHKPLGHLTFALWALRFVLHCE
jgi:hypothetical protein